MAIINGIRGVFQFLFIQLIFAKNRILENTIPIIIMIVWALIFLLPKLFEEGFSVKFILGTDDFVLVFLFIVLI